MFFAVFTMTSCIDEDKVEEKYNKRRVKEIGKIDNAIASRDFEKARDLAHTYQFCDKYGREDREERNHQLDKINKVQVTLLIENSEFEQAELLAKELNTLQMFWDIVDENINKLYKLDISTLFMILSHWQIPVYDSESTISWSNDKINQFNHIIISLIDMYIFDGNTENIKKLIPLLKPQYVKSVRRVGGKDIVDNAWHLDNLAKAKVHEKIKAAGLTLN